IASAVFFGARDTMLRGLATGTRVPPELAAVTALVSGTAVMVVYLLTTRRRRFASGLARAFRPFFPPGLLWGLSYVSLFEAYYRERVTIVSPLIATESLFGVLFAALLLRRTELVGRHLVAGAILIV